MTSLQHPTSASRLARRAAGARSSCSASSLRSTTRWRRSSSSTPGCAPRCRGCRFEIVLVDDGSTDGSDVELQKLAGNDPRVRVVQLSRNFGHQTALTAGLDHARGDAVVMLDADLQDPPELIPQMLDHWRAGCDVIYAVREQREGESRFKLATARWFYALFDRLAQVDLRAQFGRLPDARPACARRAAVDARAQPVPARHDRVGRIPPGGRPVQARSALRRHDEVHAAEDAAASRSTRSRRSRTVRSSSPRCSASSSPRWPSSRSRW